MLVWNTTSSYLVYVYSKLDVVDLVAYVRVGLVFYGKVVWVVLFNEP